MFSGGNPNREGFNNLKQFGHFSNMHNSSAASAAAAAAGPGGIDWAQLAQQWIQMRDTTSNIGMEPQDYGIPAAPPPPIISTMAAYQTTKANKQTYEEQGEADMEMDEEIDADKHSDNESVPPPAPTVTQSQWYGAGSSPDTANNSNSQWNIWPPRVSVPPPGVTPVPVIQTTVNPTAHIPSLLKINVSNPNETLTQQSSNENSNNGLDAQKRKMLPAWIREGLEKMEREKQRQLERQQPSSSSKDSFSDKHEQSTFAQETNTPVNLLNMSNVASESESGNEEDHYDEITREHNTTQTDGELEHAGGVAATAERGGGFVTRTATTAVQQKKHVIGKSYEQKLADLMSVVRRTLTELLLETTNEEIASVAQDAIKTQRAKASSAQVIRKSALSSITGKLGLAAYADSSSDESSADTDNEDDDAQNDKGKTDNDSEEELKATIRAKRRAFAKTIEDIEERVALAEQREEQRLKYFRQLEQERAEAHKRKYDDYDNMYDSKMKTVGGAMSVKGKEYARDFGETTTTTTDTKLQQFNGKRVNRKERTTRFSDNKDGKSVALGATTSYLSHMQQVSSGNGNGNGTGGGVGVVVSATSNKPLPVPNPATALLQMPESVAHYAANNTGMVNMLSAADAALEKAAAVKVKTSGGQKNKRHNRRRPSSDESSSSSSSSSTDDDDSTNSNDKSSSNSSSSSSHQSKQSRTSSGRRRRRRGYDDDVANDKNYHRQSSTNSSGMRSYRGSGSSKYKHSRDDDRDHRRRHERHARSSSKRSRRHYSSDSDDDDYRSNSKRHTHGKRRSRTRSRSRSRSTYSSARSSHRKRH